MSKLAIILAWALAAHPVTWSPRLELPGLAAIDQRLARADCAQPAGHPDCLALQALKSARPSRRSYLDQFRLDESALEQLPPRLALAISAEDEEAMKKAEAAGLSWKQYQPGMKVRKQGDALVARDAEEMVRLEIYARGDFNGDGIEDLLLRADGAMLHGTYTSTRLFLLTRTAPGSRLRILRQLR